MRRILVIDNHGSFTFNLVKTLQLGAKNVDVIDNRATISSEIGVYTHVVLTPGPGLPQEAGKLLEVIEQYAQNTPIMGVCLGHQAIAQYFGGVLGKAKEIVHGEATDVWVQGPGHPIFKGFPASFRAGRYHSWEVQARKLPKCLNIIAQTEDKTIMGIQHKQLPICGVQFHPESILTSHGARMMQNWLAYTDTDHV